MGGKMENVKELSDIFDIIGSRGKYQKILLFAVVVPISICIPLLYMTPIYLFYVPNHWCHVSGNQNLTSQELNDWKKQNLPIEIGADGVEKYSQCTMYNDRSQDVVDCPTGWDYDRTDFAETMASEFDWVCSKAHYPTTLFTIIQIGIVSGTIIFGQLADRIGRSSVLLISLCVYIIFRFLSLFIPQYFIPMVIVTFVSSTGYQMSKMMAPMIVSELCDDGIRSWVISLSYLSYAVGMAAVPYISYFIGHWFYIEMATTLISCSMFFLWIFLPESPIWLTSVGRTKEAAGILAKIARINNGNTEITKEQLETILKKISENRLCGSGAQQDKNTNLNSNFATLFSRFRLAKHIILLTISWASSYVIYECITLNTPNMPGDQFFNFFLLSIIELPAYMTASYLISKVGRRWTSTMFFLISSISSFIGAMCTSIPAFSTVGIVAMFFAKFSCCATFVIVVLQATELMPTPLRATGSSFASTTSSLLAVVVPSIVFISNYFKAAPYIVMGCVGGLAMLTSSFLPESMHQSLPDTIEAANDLGRGTPYWSYRVVPKKHPSTSNSNSSSHPPYSTQIQPGISEIAC